MSVSRFLLVCSTLPFQRHIWLFGSHLPRPHEQPEWLENGAPHPPRDQDFYRDDIAWLRRISMVKALLRTQESRPLHTKFAKFLLDEFSISGTRQLQVCVVVMFIVCLDHVARC